MKKIISCTLALLMTGCYSPEDNAREMSLALLSEIVSNAPVRKNFNNQKSFEEASYNYYEQQGRFKSITTAKHIRYSESCSGYPMPTISFNEKRNSDQPIVGQVSGDPLVCIDIPSGVLKGSKYKEVALYYSLLPRHSSPYNKVTAACKIVKGSSINQSYLRKCLLKSGDFSAVIEGKKYTQSVFRF